MTLKMNSFLSAALSMAVLGATQIQAATPAAPTMAAPASTNAPVATTSSSTNAKPTDPMIALFGDPVIAKGQGFEIKRSQLDEIMGTIKAKAASQGQTITQEQLGQFKQMALADLIAGQLLLQKATDADKATGQKEAVDQIAKILKQFGSQEALDRQLKAGGKTMDDLRTQAVQSATTTAVLVRELNATPAAADIKKYYEDHPADFEQAETARASHILLLTMDPTSHNPLSDDQVKAKRKQIDDLLKRVKAGEDFSKLATQYSEDPGSKNNGGELPPFEKGRMVPEFEAAAFALKTNEVSDVVTTSYGFHIIKLLEKTPAKKLEFSNVADNIKDYLTLEKIKELAPPFVAKLKKTANVEILDPELKALPPLETAAPDPLAPAAK